VGVSNSVFSRFSRHPCSKGTNTRAPRARFRAEALN
jgi:hypothetical protein